MTRYYTESRASIHRGVYPLAVEATDLYEGARRPDRGVARLDPRGDDLHRQRDRGDQPRRLHVGAPERPARRPRRADRDGAPLQHRPLADPLPGPEAELAYVPVLEDGQLDLEALDALLERGPKLVGVVHVSNVLGTINPVETIVTRAHDAGAVGAGRRVPGGSPDAGRPARDRRRLLRLDRAQGLRADRHRRAPRTPCSCSRRCRRSSAAGT